MSNNKQPIKLNPGANPSNLVEMYDNVQWCCNSGQHKGTEAHFKYDISEDSSSITFTDASVLVNDDEMKSIFIEVHDGKGQPAVNLDGGMTVDISKLNTKCLRFTYEIRTKNGCELANQICDIDTSRKTGSTLGVLCLISPKHNSDFDEVLEVDVLENADVPTGTCVITLTGQPECGSASIENGNIVFDPGEFAIPEGVTEVVIPFNVTVGEGDCAVTKEATLTICHVAPLPLPNCEPACVEVEPTVKPPKPPDYQAFISDITEDVNGVTVDNTGDSGDPIVHYEWNTAYNPDGTIIQYGDEVTGTTAPSYGADGTGVFTGLTLAQMCNGGYFTQTIDTQNDVTNPSGSESVVIVPINCATLESAVGGEAVTEDLSDDIACEGATTYALISSSDATITLTGSTLDFPATLPLGSYTVEVGVYDADGNICEILIVTKELTVAPCLDGLCSDCCLEPIILTTANEWSFYGGSVLAPCPDGSIIPTFRYVGTGTLTTSDFTYTIAGNVVNLIETSTGNFEADGCIPLPEGTHEVIISGTDSQGMSFTNMGYAIMYPDFTTGLLSSVLGNVTIQDNANSCKVSIGWKQSTSYPNEYTIDWDDGSANDVLIDPFPFAGTTRHDYESAGEGSYTISVTTDHATEGLQSVNAFEVSISCN